MARENLSFWKLPAFTLQLCVTFHWQLLLSARGSVTHSWGCQCLCCTKWVLPTWQAGSSCSLPAWGAQLEDVSFPPLRQPELTAFPVWALPLSAHTGGEAELGPVPPCKMSETSVFPWLKIQLYNSPYFCASDGSKGPNIQPACCPQSLLPSSLFYSLSGYLGVSFLFLDFAVTVFFVIYKDQW